MIEEFIPVTIQTFHMLEEQIDQSLVLKQVICMFFFFFLLKIIESTVTAGLLGLWCITRHCNYTVWPLLPNHGSGREKSGNSIQGLIHSIEGC